MRKLVMFVLTLTASVFSFVRAQDRGVQWKKYIGDKKSEGFSKIVPAVDGGYLLIGDQEPPDGSTYFTNLWLVKVNNVGAVEWQKTYGGSGHEWGMSGVATADGGFMILCGSTTYTNNGDVTGHHGLDPTVPVHNDDEHPQDIWVVKINASGTLLWAKAYGGSRFDEGHAIIKASDGNYMVAGRTSSWDGNLTGNRRSTEGPTGRDNADMWVFKINETGNLLWQKCYGGYYDEGASDIIEKTNGFLVAGWTYSNDMDVTGLHNAAGFNSDAWIIDIDMTGAINWSKTYGGTGDESASAILLYNSGYLIGGAANSNNGDVSGYHQPPPGSIGAISDIWLFELNATGNLTWQMPIGTTNNDGFNDFIISPDNEITLIGSGSTGSFFDHIYSPLVMKLDNNKNVVYQQILSDLQGARISSITSSDNHNFYIAGSVGKRNYKFPEDHIGGGRDAMFLKFGDVNTVTGKVFIDNNANNIYDSGDELVNNARVMSGKNGNLNYGSVTSKGVYSNSVDTGTYTTSAYIDNPNYTITPVTASATFSNYFDTAMIDFALTMIPGRNDLQAVLLPLLPARPGFNTKYRIKVSNKGTTTKDAVVKLVKDPNLLVVSSLPVAESIVNDTISWSIASFAPFRDSSFTIIMQVAAPPTVNNGDSLKLRVEVSPVSGDVMPGDNADTVKHRVTGSFDPNDKTETHGGVISPQQVSGDDPLTYVIRFQNNGTDTAFNITVRDTLENRLDWNSLQMISASHSYQLAIEDGNKLTWQFNNIKLPYTGIDEPNSHGYIAYRIKPKSTVPVGDTIKNTAGIYFDYNLPIATNTEKTIVFLLSAPLPVTLVSFNAALTGSVVNVIWKTGIEENLKHFEVLRSANGIDFTTIGIVQPGQTAYLFKDKEPLKGYNYYRLRSVDLDGSSSYSTIVLVNVKNGAEIISSLYPNPATGHATLKLHGTVDGNVLVQVLDQQGRLVTTRQFGLQHTGEFKTPLDLGNLSKGSYVLRIVVNDKTYLHKLLIQ